MLKEIETRIDAMFKEIETKTKAVIEYNGLTPIDGGFLDDDYYVFCHVVSTNFKALEKTFNEIKAAYANLVVVFDYKPMSGNMNEIVLEFKFNNYVALNMLPAEIITVTKTELRPDTEYHPWCGGYYDAGVYTRVTRHYCSKCNKELPSADASYCMHCGVEFTK